MTQGDRNEPRAWNDNLKTTAGSTSSAGSTGGAGNATSNPAAARKPSMGERWRKAQPTKMMLVWVSLASIALTLFIGFRWGGWTTSASAETMAATAARAAVVQRLAPICVAQFNADPDKSAKLGQMSGMSTVQSAKFVQEQGWATITGTETPDRQVADACMKLLLTP